MEYAMGLTINVTKRDSPPQKADLNSRGKTTPRQTAVGRARVKEGERGGQNTTRTVLKCFSEVNPIFILSYILNTTEEWQNFYISRLAHQLRYK